MKALKIPRDFWSINCMLRAPFLTKSECVPTVLQWREADLIWIVIHNEPSYVQITRGLDIVKLVSFFV